MKAVEEKVDSLAKSIQAKGKQLRELEKRRNK